MDYILKIENLRLSFNGPNGKVPAVKGATIEVKPGETLALVGESGCGKTAMCRCVLKLHSDHAVIESGKITLVGEDITSYTDEEMEKVRGHEVSMIFQDPMSSLNPTFSIGEQIAEPLMLHMKMNKEEARRRAIELLTMVGIENAQLRYKQYPHHFSGGMRQRVAIAIAIACNPKLIIADEPTTSLDTRTQNKIMDLLTDISKDKEKAMIFVTHDLGLAYNMADRIAVMKDGVIVEMGPCDEIFKRPRHEYTKRLLRYVAYGKGNSHYHGTVKESATYEDEENIVKVKNLTKCFSVNRKHSITVLKDFSLNIGQGEIVGIVGDSGCGKSTLARCMMGIHNPTSGEIIYKEGINTQMIFQDSASAFNPRMTIEEIISEPLVIGKKKMSKAERLSKVYEIMEVVELERELATRFPYDVSGGQRQRAAIGRALITDPDFIIADEPISSLDVSIQSQIIHLLKKLHDERKLTIMIIAHDLPMVEHISDRIIDMNKVK